MRLTAKTESSNELNKTRAELKSISQSLFAGQDRVTRTAATSPVRGTVKDMKITTAGGVIQQAEDIMEIVPLRDTLSIAARNRPADKIGRARWRERVSQNGYIREGVVSLKKTNTTTNNNKTNFK